MDYRFGTPSLAHLLRRELHEAANLGPSDLINGIMPMGIVQEHLSTQIQSLTLTNLKTDKLCDKMRDARDWREAERFEFIKIRDLSQYCREFPVYSHSKPLFTTDEGINLLRARIAEMRGEDLDFSRS